MVSNSRDRNIDSSRREDARKGQVTRCEVIYVRPHVAPYPEDKDFNTVDMRMIDWPREGDKPIILEYVKLNSLLRYHGKFQGEPWTPRIGDMIYVYWLEEREALVLGLCTSIEQEPVCRSQADAHHQEYVFKLSPWEEPKTNQDGNYVEFPNPKHPECYKWWPKTRDSLWIFDCLEGHNTPSCCGQACNSLDDHQSSTCFKNFSDISPTTIDLPRRFKFLHRCGSFWYYDDDGTIHIAGKVSGNIKNQQIFYPSGKILLENVVDSCDVVLDDDGDIKLNPAKTVYIDGDLNISGFCTHGGCSCEGEFAQLEGVAGGQTLCGGTEEDEELTLCGTSDASKGCVKVDADLECTGNAQLPTICGDDQVDGELVLCGTSDVSKGQVTIDADLECNGDLCTQIKAAIKAYCDTLYAASGGSVTNGDSHDHSGGDGAQIDHGELSGLSDDDHSIYLKLSGRTGYQKVLGLSQFVPPNFGSSVYGNDFSEKFDSSTAGRGFFLGWNRTAGGGESDFINHHGAGSPGGFRFYEYNQSSKNIDLLFEVQGNGNVYVPGNCSALSFTDRTPGYAGDALSELKNVINDAQGRINHKTLPAFARAKFTDPSTGQETEGRNIGNMVSILTKAVQQLTEKLEVAEKKIAVLEGKETIQASQAIDQRPTKDSRQRAKRSG
jgi:hypothetical protein